MSRLEKAREKKYKRKKRIAVCTGALCLLTLVGLLAFSGWSGPGRSAGQDNLGAAGVEESDAQNEDAQNEDVQNELESDTHNDYEGDCSRDIYDPFETESAVVSGSSTAEPELQEDTQIDEPLELTDEVTDEVDEEAVVEAGPEEQVKTSVQGDTESELFRGELIDTGKSAAFIDFFALTHVHVYINEGRKVSEVSVNGKALAYRDVEGRYELVMDDLAGGEELNIVAYCAEETGCFQELLLSVEEF